MSPFQLVHVSKLIQKDFIYTLDTRRGNNAISFGEGFKKDANNTFLNHFGILE